MYFFDQTVNVLVSCTNPNGNLFHIVVLINKILTENKSNVNGYTDTKYQQTLYLLGFKPVTHSVIYNPL